MPPAATFSCSDDPSIPSVAFSAVFQLAYLRSVPAGFATVALDSFKAAHFLQMVDVQNACKQELIAHVAVDGTTMVHIWPFVFVFLPACCLLFVAVELL